MAKKAEYLRPEYWAERARKGDNFTPIEEAFPLDRAWQWENLGKAAAAIRHLLGGRCRTWEGRRKLEEVEYRALNRAAMWRVVASYMQYHKARKEVKDGQAE